LKNESTRISKAALRALPGYTPEGRGPYHLQIQRPAQAAPGLTERK